LTSDFVLMVGGYTMAENWWSVEFDAGYNCTQLQNQFADLFEKVGRPRGAALFLEKRRGAESALFFTPSAAEFAKDLIAFHGGKPCQPPQRATAFLVGHEQDRTMVPLPRPLHER
jgi:hypothetical protein